MLNTISYVILMLLGIVFAILYPHYEVFLFVGIAVLFPALSFLASAISSIFVKVTIKGEERQIYKDEDCTIGIEIENRSFLPIHFCMLKYTYKYEIESKPIKGKLKFSLRGREKKVLSLNVRAQYCGTVLLLLKSITVKDSFRVFSFSKRVRKEYRQSIYPKLITLEMDVKDSVSFYNDEYDEFYEDHPGNDPSEVYEIREYREGDRLSRIHWKVSSKKDKYMVKEYSDPVVINAIIVLDNACQAKGKERVRQWGTLLEKAAWARYSLMQDKVSHYIYWFDGEQTKGERFEIRNEVDFAAVMSRILRCKPNEDTLGYQNYLLHSEQIKMYPNIFYVGEQNRLQLEQNGVDIKVVE